MMNIARNVLKNVLNSHHSLNKDNFEIKRELSEIFEYIFKTTDHILTEDMLTGIIYAHIIMYFNDISIMQIRDMVEKEYREKLAVVL